MGKRAGDDHDRNAMILQLVIAAAAETLYVISVGYLGFFGAHKGDNSKTLLFLLFNVVGFFYNLVEAWDSWMYCFLVLNPISVYCGARYLQQQGKYKMWLASSDIS